MRVVNLFETIDIDHPTEWDELMRRLRFHETLRVKFHQNIKAIGDYEGVIHLFSNKQKPYIVREKFDIKWFDSFRELLLYLHTRSSGPVIIHEDD